MRKEEKSTRAEFAETEYLSLLFPVEDKLRVQWLVSTLNAIHEGVVVVDRTSVILYANPAYTRIFGVPVKKVLGKKLSDIEPVSKILKVLNTGLSIVDEHSHVYSLDIDIIANITPIFEQSQLIGAVAVFRDISEIQALQGKLQKAQDEVERMKNLSDRYYSELKQLRAQLLARNELVVESPQMKEILEKVLKVGQVQSTVLITGESGVGKEVIARLIHRVSARKEGPFVAVNCGAIPENLMESEFFGYEQGAFTGANRKGKHGYLDLAQNGTLFLDEVGSLPFNLQVKILRVLQGNSFIRVGGVDSVEVNVRFIAATNKDLKEMVDEKLFREDLYYRLNVVPIYIPPLRERRQDIEPLMQSFLQKFNDKYEMKKQISPEVVKILENYPWPGNVRELENVVERLVVSVQSNIINLNDENLAFLLQEHNYTEDEVIVTDIINLKHGKEMLERQLISKAIQKYGTTRRAAQALGVDHTTVLRKAKQYGIQLKINNES